MDSGDEAFDKFIVVSEEDDNSKENVSDKAPKTSRNQYDMLISYKKAIEKHKVSKAEVDRFWKELSVKLNEIGPPCRDSIEWRRVWTVYKYNQKRKQATIAQAGNRRPLQDPFGNVCPPGTGQNQSGSTLRESIHPANVQIQKRRSRQDLFGNVCPPGTDQNQSGSTLLEGIHPATVQVHKRRSPQDTFGNMRPSGADWNRSGSATVRSAEIGSRQDPFGNVCPPGTDQNQSDSGISENVLQSLAIRALETLDRISTTLNNSHDLLKQIANNQPPI